MAVFALAAGIGILMFGVGRGIEKANKIMMPVFLYFSLFLASMYSSSPVQQTDINAFYNRHTIFIFTKDMGICSCTVAFSHYR